VRLAHGVELGSSELVVMPDRRRRSAATSSEPAWHGACLGGAPRVRLSKGADMRSASLSLAVLLSTVFSAALAPRAPQADGLEPEVELVLELNGYPLEVRVDEPFQVSVGEDCVSGVLRKRDRRRFELDGLVFSYPSYLAFRADLAQPAAQRWTLTGNEVELALIRHVDPRLPARTLLEAEVERLKGAGEADVRYEHLSLAGERRTGRVVRTMQDGVGVQRRVFALSNGEDVFVLVLAENLDARGKPVAEGAELVRLLEETFRLR